MEADRVMSAELPVADGNGSLRVSLEAMPAGYRVVLASAAYNQVVECETWGSAAHWFHALVLAHRRGNRSELAARRDLWPLSDHAVV